MMRPRSTLPLLLLALLLLPPPSSAQVAADETGETAVAAEAAEDVPPAEDAADDAAYGAFAFLTDISPCDAEGDAACSLESRTCYLYGDGSTGCGYW